MSASKELVKTASDATGISFCYSYIISPLKKMVEELAFGHWLVAAKYVEKGAFEMLSDVEEKNASSHSVPLKFDKLVLFCFFTSMVS